MTEDGVVRPAGGAASTERERPPHSAKPLQPTGVLRSPLIVGLLAAGFDLAVCGIATALLLTAAAPAAGQDGWTATSTAGAPAARRGHTGVWTGSRMIVWGGAYFNGTVNVTLNTGGVFDPVANAWSPMATARARFDHVAVWTGSKMIVWGGNWNIPEIYNLATNTWTQGTTAGAPQNREGATAVWTGSKMIVWGGYSNTGSGTTFNTGGVYNPATDSWTATATSGAPSARMDHQAVWTGSRMIVWGGVSAGWTYTNTGGIYDPATNTWTAMSIVGAPGPRRLASAVWTGSKMIVWGGEDAFSDFNTGGVYDPATDTWTTLSTYGTPSSRYSHSAVWTGSHMIVWGGWDAGPLSTGGIYDPLGDAWVPTSTAGAPSHRNGHIALWTGSRMIVWGGNSPDAPGGSYSLNTGGIYEPFAFADLSITKTDGVTAVTPGVSVSYTIRASNAGPRPVTNARVVDTFPASLGSINWTCSASVGSSCAAASGPGNINQAVSLAVSGAATFVATGTLNPAATGTLVNAATVAPPSGIVDLNVANNSATDADTILIPADVSVTNEDGLAAAAPGQAITYEIVASNAGPNPVSGVTVSDPVPASLLLPAWTCVAAGGASCTASGSGDISDTIDLPVGGTASYTLSGTLSSNPPGLSNTATVTLPAGYGDPNPSDNSATDADLILYPSTEFYTVPPCRVIDTRNPVSPAGGPALVGNSTRTFPMTGGDCGIPSTAFAVSINVTVIEPAAQGNLRLYRSDLETAPLVSNINFLAGQTRANNAVVALAPDGTIKVKNASAGLVHLVLDVNGYFQ